MPKAGFLKALSGLILCAKAPKAQSFMLGGPDKYRTSHITLLRWLPRESNTKEIDAAAAQLLWLSALHCADHNLANESGDDIKSSSWKTLTAYKSFYEMVIRHVEDERTLAS